MELGIRRVRSAHMRETGRGVEIRRALGRDGHFVAGLPVEEVRVFG
jgi:hypothetical protein